MSQMAERVSLVKVNPWVRRARIATSSRVLVHIDVIEYADRSVWRVAHHSPDAGSMPSQVVRHKSYVEFWEAVGEVIEFETRVGFFRGMAYREIDY